MSITSNADNQNEAADRLENLKHDLLKDNNIAFKETDMKNVVETLNDKLAELGVYRVTGAKFPNDNHSYAALVADSLCRVKHTGDVLGIEEFVWNELEVVFTHFDIEDDFEGEIPSCLYVFAKRTANKLINYLDEVFANQQNMVSAVGLDLKEKEGPSPCVWS